MSYPNNPFYEVELCSS